ncbi:UDP-glucose 4-epimerase [soil metagenome]
MHLRVLVTGGAGFVGSNTVDALLAGGHAVAALDDLSTGEAANVVERVPLLVADIADAAATSRAVEGQRFDAVVHLASKTKVVQSMEEPELYRRVIVDGTANVLAAARATGAGRFVNVSSGGVIYGLTTGACASEELPIAPVSPYGRYKAEAEAVVGADGISSLTLRPANIYGPRQRTDLEGGVVAIFQRCWREGEPLTVYGDGTMERDYVYVEDVASAVVAALTSAREGIYNVGTGVATSVNALIESMSEVLGPPPGVRYGAIRSGELARNCLDASKAARDGLWQPRVSLREGLARMVAV